MKFFDCSAIERKIGYVFNNKALLKQAFTRASYCNEMRQIGKEIQSNEVLEFCGDSILAGAIITILMERYSKMADFGIITELGEGDFSNIKSRLSDKSMLSARIKELGLYEYLLLNKGDEKMNIAVQPSVMEDLFESIIGALYFDCGKDMKIVTEVIDRMLDVDRYFEKTDTPHQRSSKNLLQEWCQARSLERPIYEVVAEFGPEHEKQYRVLCKIEGKDFAVGEGKNKKSAESDAAQKTYQALLKK